jgi:phage terminase large subunit GpA-like protein
LFAPEAPSEHAHYSAQLTAEQEVELASGITSWQKTPGREKNHYLDATYYCLAAAAILGEIEPDAAIDAAGYAERAEAAARLAPPAPAAQEQIGVPRRLADPRLEGGPRRRKARELEV